MQKYLWLPLTLLSSVLSSLAINASAAQAEYCREFNQQITIDGRSQPAYGTACMQPDGSWEIVKPAEIAPPLLTSRVVEKEIVYVNRYPSPIYTPRRNSNYFSVTLGGGRHYHNKHWRSNRHQNKYWRNKHWRHKHGRDGHRNHHRHSKY